jgi:hypothetical protein
MTTNVTIPKRATSRLSSRPLPTSNLRRAGRREHASKTPARRAWERCDMRKRPFFLPVPMRTVDSHGAVRRDRPRWHQPSRTLRRSPASAVGRAGSEAVSLRSGDRSRPTAAESLPRGTRRWTALFWAGTTVRTKGSPSGTAGWRSKPLTAASSFEGSNPSPSVRTGVSPARGQQPIGDVANVERWTRRSAGAR